MCSAEVEIKPGPELNRAVAEAIGYGPHDFSSFSTDLNAAFVAAEEVGLFSDWLLAKWTGGWYLQDHSERSMDGVETSTPALAICAAILKLKKLGPQE